MINAKDLNRCIDNLAEINANITSSNLKRLVLEVGYILKQELESVNEWNKQHKKEKNLSVQHIDVQKLLEDNTQLYNENKKLHELIFKLRETIDKKIPDVERAINNVNEKITVFSDSINQL